MIQRIQSLLLLLIAVLGIIFSFSPLLKIDFHGNIYTMNAYNTYQFSEDDGINLVTFKNIGIGTLGGLNILLSVIIIFLFKNRRLQIKLSKLLLLLITFQIVAIFVYLDASIAFLNPTKAPFAIHYKFGMFLPFISLIFSYLTIRFIKKDEKLVRSADRLR